MPGGARNGDGESGLCDVGSKCCGHDRSGQCGEGSSNVFVNGVGAFRVGDIGDCNCPHGGSFEGESGSSTVFINGRAAMRVGDETSCQVCGQGGEIEEGSENVFIGG